MFNLNFIIMKKQILLGAALLFAAGIGFAQNTNTTTQTGNLQVADVVQIGSNTAVVTQNQAGIGSNTPTYMNKADVWQSGTGNLATILQDELGGGNKGYNDAEIDQLGTNNISLQITYAPGSNSGLDVEAWQEGTGNDVYQYINGGYTDYFYTYQWGNNNKATQLGTGITHNTAKIYQNGRQNEAKQDLFGSNNGYYGGFYANERILIDQIGGKNMATQTFTGIGSSHGNTADIYQNGYYNTASQTGVGRDLYADFNQIGSYNTATSFQTGDLHRVFVNQTGEYNQATSTQTGSNHLATITQNGNSNIANNTQN